MSDRRSPLPVLALGALAVALALVATWKGPGLTDDSVNYLSTAINVADGRGWRMLADQPLTIFPPGLPAIVAVGETLGVDGQTTLRLISAISFGGIVVLGHRLIRRAVPDPSVALGATALLAVSPALLGIAKMAWSEPLFIALVLAFLLHLDEVLHRRTLTHRDTVVLAALASLAFLIRYIGVALVVLGGLALLVRLRPLDRRNLGRIATFGLLCSMVLIATMLRNHAADGTYLGQRIPSPDSVADSAHRVLVTVGGWAYPLDGPSDSTLAWLGLIVLALLSSAAIAALRSATVDPTRVAVHVGLLIVYVAYLFAASLGTAFEPINSRYLSPVYVSLVVLGASGAAAIRRRWPRPAARWVTAVAAAALLALLAADTVDQVRTGATDGIGYNTDGYVSSDLAARALTLARDEGDAVFYSNLPFGLWSATRLQPVPWAPLAEGFRGAPIEGELEALVARVACAPDRSYLVRYRFGHPRAMSVQGIRQALDVRRVVVADDGAIFQLTLRGSVPCVGEAPSPVARR